MQRKAFVVESYAVQWPALRDSTTCIDRTIRLVHPESELIYKQLLPTRMTNVAARNKIGRPGAFPSDFLVLPNSFWLARFRLKNDLAADAGARRLVRQKSTILWRSLE